MFSLHGGQPAVGDPQTMKRYSILIGLLLFLGFVTPAHATTTSEVFINNVSTAPFWTNSSNLTGAPDSNYATLSSSSPTFIVKFPSSSVPAGAQINGIIFKRYGNSTGNSGGTYATSMGFSYGLGGVIDCANPSGDGFPYPLGNGTVSYTVDASNCTNFSTVATVSNLNSSQMGLNIFNRSGINASWDAISLSVDYTLTPSLSITNLTASAGAQRVRFNASGDTTFTQAGEQCKISLYEYDISNPTSPQIVSGGVAYVLLDASHPRTTTLDQGQSTYLGYGFTSSVSTWAADNISMPYFNSKNTDIRAYTSCYHQTTNSDGSLSTPIYDLRFQALDPSLNNPSFPYAKTLIATPSALQNNTGYVQPQCTSTDIICQVMENVQNTLISLFAPNQQINNESFSNVNDALAAHAPFAYGLALLNTNTSISTVASNSATSLSFDFSHVSGVTIPTQYQHMSYSDTGSIRDTVYAPLRPYEIIILYVILLLYLITVIGGLFT